jgi:hydrophobic/amphiphilic exporter-1 (mainly G- bacteria), HAE1 family
MTISELCVRRPIFAIMLITFLVVLGVFSFHDLGVDLFPKTDPAIVNVSVRLAGATPEEVLTQVVLPLEDAVSVVSGLDTLDTQIQDGTARITCTFVLERDIEGAAQDIREKVAGAIKNLPPNIDPPIIQKSDPDSDPVLSLVVGGTGSLRQTTEIADKQIVRVLETVDGVGAVSMSGGRQREIRIYADADKLNAYGITINQLRNSIQSENVEIPGGDIIRGDTQVGVRTLGRLEASGQFGDITVANVGGKPVRVRDVGRVEDSYPDPTTWFALVSKDGKTHEGVSLDVRRQSGTNTVKVVEAAKAKLVQIQKTLPPGTTIQVIRDGSLFINASVEALEEHLLLGSILAAIVVLLFLRNWRAVMVAAVAIPTSIIATFTLMKYMGFTLNNMTLLALTLAVGIVIDDAIVVLENIIRWVEEKHADPIEAAVGATREITLAVMATTLSLVIIFIPIAFITGIAQRYLHEFGWTMAFALLVSMLVSFTLTPMMSSKILRRKTMTPADSRTHQQHAAEQASSTGQPPPAEHTSKDLAFFRWIDDHYGRMLEWSLDHRLTVILIAAGTLATVIPLNTLVGRDFIPSDDQGEFEVLVDLPVGYSLMGSAALASDMAAKVVQIPEVVFGSIRMNERPNHYHIYLRLKDLSERKRSHNEIADEIRARIFPLYPNLQSKISMPSALGSGEIGGAVRPSFLGPDLANAAILGKQAMEIMQKMPGLTDFSVDVSLNSPELEVKIDRQRASDLGVHAADVGNAVRLMIAGTDQISTYKEGDEQYPVVMQLLPEQQRNLEVLGRLMIPSAKVGQVRLDNIAAIQRASGPTRINRTNRQFRVSANANNVVSLPLGTALQQTATALRALHMPPGFSYRFLGNAKNMDETNQNLITAFLLASVFMYMVLAAQFESLVNPLIIMLALPLSIPFALFTLWITGRTMNLWSSLGVFLMLGIVKKNGILQVDCTNQLRREGVPLREAIVRANHMRLRPILMTTTSIIAGLIPTAIGAGVGGAQRSAIAITIIGGLSLCLLLTLLMTPVTYSLFASLERAPEQQRVGLFTRLRLGLARVFS